MTDLKLELRLGLMAEEIRTLTERVDALEKKFGKVQSPLKKRVKLYLEAENNNLYAARERAKNSGDDEAVKSIEQLMDRAD